MVTNNKDDEFAIRVALIGYVSVGKTTLLNAILGDKYSEVSMKRTTAAVNIFKLHFMDKDDRNKEDGDDSSEKEKDSDEEKDRSAADISIDQAASTLSEITKDNRDMRKRDELQEKVFDIILPEALVEMREKTKLHLIDVPGINEAGASEKYSTYVSENWHTFDCVVLILDGRQGVNTEEQMKLLHFVHERSKSIRDIPIITVMNKIDNPEEEEQRNLTNEAKSALQKLFNKFNCGLEPREVVADTVSSSERTLYSPYLVPLSALHAFIYRTAAKYNFDTFIQKIDLTLIDRLVRDSYGRRWAKFDNDEKYVKAYEIVRDPKELKDALEASNFHEFLKAFDFAVGGATKQQAIIQEQIMWNASHLSIHNNYVQDIQCMYETCVRLGHSNEFASNAAASEFQKLIVESIKDAFCLFLSEPEKSSHLSKPMREIFVFWELCKRMGTNDQSFALTLIGLMKQMVLLQIKFLIKAFNEKGPAFLTFLPLDWQTVFGSLVRQSRSPFFDSLFGTIVGIVLEDHYHEVKKPKGFFSQKCTRCNKPFISRSFYEIEREGSSTFSNVYSICCNVVHVESEISENICYFNDSSNLCHERRHTLKHGRCRSCGKTTTLKPRISVEKQETMSSIFLNDFGSTLIFSQNAKVNMPKAPDCPENYGHLIWRLGQFLEISGMISHIESVREAISGLGLDTVLSVALVEAYVKQNDSKISSASIFK